MAKGREGRASNGATSLLLRLLLLLTQEALPKGLFSSPENGKVFSLRSSFTLGKEYSTVVMRKDTLPL